MNDQRLARVNELIKREVGEILTREFEHESNQLVTVTEVITNDDLLTAHVKVSIWPPDAHALFESLARQAGRFQHLLNQRLRMHPVPKIVFELDSRIAEAGRIEELLEEVKNEER